jgi:hypothetical protein
MHLSCRWDKDLVRQSIMLTRALILGAILVMLGLIARTDLTARHFVLL